ncbi:hypothetical protein AVEN_11053-1 [Araneus ventricosus]|uniref:Uncharacterized protein n=1 Tax=Araneus ventricosus TaxID=182803 RepID=A0A4Y2NE04_ARAVE|nr:hypothetical protein AVEN_11053-1 [Araneus ventricosus]
MEKDALFTNIQEKIKHRKEGKRQHLYKLATQTDNKSLVITVIALSTTFNSPASTTGKTPKRLISLPRAFPFDDYSPKIKVLKISISGKPLEGRGGLVVSSPLWDRRVPGSKPDSTEDPPCLGPAAR